MTAVDDLLGNFWFLLFATITIISVVGTIAHSWQKIRRAETATRLKQTMLERGLSVDEMDRLLRPTASSDDESDTQNPAPESIGSDGQLVQSLTSYLAGHREETIQRVMEALNASDPPGKRLLCHAIIGLFEGAGGNEKEILAIVRGFCRPEGQGVGKGQDAEPKRALPVAETGGKWDSHGIRAEPGSTADRPRG
jgi:hypothetical protein